MGQSPVKSGFFSGVKLVACLCEVDELIIDLLQVCDLWKNYLIKERVWQKCVETYARRYPSYIEQVNIKKIDPILLNQKDKPQILA